MPRTVAVVGAGAAGLVAARELLREGHAVTVFERSARVGGTWAYDPRSDPDPPCLDTAAAGAAAVHGSLYASLRTNLPRELMGFSGFALAGRVFAGDPRTFPGHREVLAFLDAFAVESGVAGRVRLRAEVVRVGPLAGHGERWTVAWRGEGGVEEEEEVFDAVVVCNGHCTVPLVPKLRGIGNWQGKQMHSHNYRTPEPFQDQIVVVVGLGASGVDIAREISNVAKEVHIASRYTEDRLGKVDCIQDDGQVRFSEGSASIAADTFLYCTGYRYHFPFLDVEGVTVDGNRVGPLYKHVFPPKHAPNLSFVGLPVKARDVYVLCRPSCSSRSSWSRGGSPGRCRGGPSFRARRPWRPPWRRTTGGWTPPGSPSGTRTPSCLTGWSTWTGWRRRSASRPWRRGGGRYTRRLSGASGLWMTATGTAGRRKTKKRIDRLIEFSP
ncbi:flavin-containing monooxygenase FMO GS-OX-like 2 isoform X2 [Oryza glaberrima]|uniref:flavin-containing monooxygenase FMO GS-OX-like 2 isoform X2 n=1 Tax=Oryza glaberrima TaxID=4538 RepID=UPI00224C0279|nr:flavin-containing monooxygenase FMO GS-OX-like 2 isoform X2 [Oryza glaberrima]